MMVGREWCDASKKCLFVFDFGVYQTGCQGGTDRIKPTKDRMTGSQELL